MKILFIGKVPTDLISVKGGIESANLNLLKGFSKIKHINVKMISFDKDLIETFTLRFADNINITFYPYKFPKSEFINILFFEKKIIQEIYRNYLPDIIHYQGSGPHLVSILGLDKKRTIITMHGLLVKELRFQFGWKKKIRVLVRAVFDMILLRHFKNFIFISRYNFTQLKKMEGKKVDIIPNAIPNIIYKKPTKIINNQLLFVGAISKLKNLPLIFETISELDREGINLYLTIAGGFKDMKYEKYLFKLKDQLNISHLITFKGWVNQEELMKLYESNYILVLPSRQENLPVCILEAMAHGNVVVSANVGGTSELIDNNITGFLFNDNNKKELKNILIMLYNNVDLINQIGENAYNKMAEFNSGNIALKTTIYYSKICMEN